MATFNERLKQVRTKLGFTQEALARSAGLSLSTVHKLEQTDVDPSWSTVQALARALGVECTALMEEAAAAEKPTLSTAWREPSGKVRAKATKKKGAPQKKGGGRGTG